LLAEALAAEDMRRRDPVKRAIIGGTLVIALVLVWSSSLLLKNMLAKKDLEQVQGEIDDRTNAYAVVTANLNKISDIQKKVTSLQQLSSARFLQGNVLNALQAVYVPGVQLTRLQVAQNYDIVQAALPVRNNFGLVAAGHPGSSTERITVSLDAKDNGSNPGDQVNKFKDAIGQQSFFQANLTTNDGVRLSNLSAPQSTADGKPFVLFTIECRFKTQTR
jgi:hypothetical protein